MDKQENEFNSLSDTKLEDMLKQSYNVEYRRRLLAEQEKRNEQKAIIKQKEQKKRDDREDRSLAISEEALRTSRRATKIAISAIILSIITAIGIAIFQWLTKN